MDWKRWAGYYVPRSYQLHHENEYYAIRSAAGLIDISPLFKLRIAGPDSLALLNRVFVRDLSRLKEGRLAYVAWCDSEGYVLGDGTVLRQGPETYFFTCEDPTAGWLERHASGMNVTITDESRALAGLALQGPSSARILIQAGAGSIHELKYFGATSTSVNGVEFWVSRSGYTGDLGYEMWPPADRAPELWDTLMDVGSKFALRAVGLKALNVCRIEAGLLQKEVDYHNASRVLTREQKSIPYELGFGWMINLDREPFVGQSALQQLQQPAWKLVGLEIDLGSKQEVCMNPRDFPRYCQRRCGPHAAPLYRDHARQNQVGYATSGTWSPVLKKYIALATIERSYPSKTVHIELAVEHSRHSVDARIVSPPLL